MSFDVTLGGLRDEEIKLWNRTYQDALAAGLNELRASQVADKATYGEVMPENKGKERRPLPPKERISALSREWARYYECVTGKRSRCRKPLKPAAIRAERGKK